MFADIFTFAGELPKELGKLVNLERFIVAGNSIGGGLYVPADMYCVFADIHLCVAGELPKELGNLVNLTDLLLYANRFQGKLYVPAYIAPHLRLIIFVFVLRFPTEATGGPCQLDTVAAPRQ